MLRRPNLSISGLEVVPAAEAQINYATAEGPVALVVAVDDVNGFVVSKQDRAVNPEVHENLPTDGNRASYKPFASV